MSDVPHPPSPQPDPPNVQPRPAAQAIPYAQPYAYPQPQPVAHPLTPSPGLPFGSMYRTPRARWWRGILSILLIVAAIPVINLIFSFIAIAIDMALGNTDAEAIAAGQIGMTPALLTATNLSLLCAALLAVIGHRFINGVGWGFLHSVTGRLRSNWLLLTLAVVVPVYVLFAASSLLDPAYQDLRLDGTVIAFAIIIVLTTPLQAAAEEYMFRGVIQRSAGSWIRSPRWSFIVGTVVSAPLFAVFHFAGDPWLILYYLCFGILLSILTQLTGGLEAAIAIHAANNVFMLLVGALAGQMTEGFDRSAGEGGPAMLVPVAVLIVVVLVVWWLSKRRQVETTTAEAAPASASSFTSAAPHPGTAATADPTASGAGTPAPGPVPPTPGQHPGE